MTTQIHPTKAAPCFARSATPEEIATNSVNAMTAKLLQECAEHFALFKDDDTEALSLGVLREKVARRLLRLVERERDVETLMRLVSDLLPDSTDADRPRAVLEGIEALRERAFDDFYALGWEVLSLLRRSA